MIQYGKSLDGLIHLLSNVQGGEFTLCGNAEEGPCLNDSDDDKAWTQCKPQKITCPDCIRQIEDCKEVPKKFL